MPGDFVGIFRIDACIYDIQLFESWPEPLQFDPMSYPDAMASLRLINRCTPGSEIEVDIR